MTTLTLPSKLPDILPQVEESTTTPSLPAGPLNPSGASPLRKSIVECLAVLADQSGYSAVAFLAGLLLARVCTKTEYGFFVLGMSIVFTGEVILLSLIAIPFTVLCHGRSPEDRRIYAIHCLIQQGVLSLATIALFGLIHGVALGMGFPAELTRWMLGFSVAAGLIHLRAFARSVLLAEIRVWRNLAAGLAMNLLIALALLALYAYGRLSIVSATAILACGAAAFALITLGFDPAPPPIRPGRFLDDCRANWNYGKWILLANGINLMGIRIFPWLTLLWWDPQTVATVGVLSTLACAIRPAVQAGMSYLIPSLAQQARLLGRSHAISQGLTAAGIAAGLGLLFTVGMGLFGDALTRLLYTDQYEGHRFSLFLISAAMALKAVDVPLRAALTAVQNPRFLSYSPIVATLLAVGCAVFLIPQFGVAGVAASILIHSLGYMAVDLGYIIVLRTTAVIPDPIVASSAG
jgi:O-antigen/teichoic acid export membrane protein